MKIKIVPGNEVSTAKGPRAENYIDDVAEEDLLAPEKFMFPTWIHMTGAVETFYWTVLTQDQRKIALEVMKDPHRRSQQTSLWSMPTLHSGHDADLKLEWIQDSQENPSHYRIWISRMTIADGAPSDYGLILEQRYTDSREKWGWRQFHKKAP